MGKAESERTSGISNDETTESSKIDISDLSFIQVSFKGLGVGANVFVIRFVASHKVRDRRIISNIRNKKRVNLSR